MQRIQSFFLSMTVLTVALFADSQGFYETYHAPNRANYFTYAGPNDIGITVEYWGRLPHDPWLINFYPYFEQGTRECVDGTQVNTYSYSFIIGSPPILKSPEKLHQDGENYFAVYDSYDIAERHGPCDSPSGSSDWTMNDFKNALFGKRIAILCGPGVAKEAGVMTRDEFIEAVGLWAPFEPIDEFVKTLFSNPRDLANILKERGEKGYTGDPSPVHLALARLANEAQCSLFNANFDTIFEKTDIEPQSIWGEDLKAELDALDLPTLDYFICVGLDGDDRGILGYFITKNPEGRIIAIEDSEPVYIEESDIWIEGIHNLGALY